MVSPVSMGSASRRLRSSLNFNISLPQLVIDDASQDPRSSLCIADLFSQNNINFDLNNEPGDTSEKIQCYWGDEMPSLPSFPENPCSLVSNEVKKYLNASLIASIYFLEALCYAQTIIQSYNKRNDNGTEKKDHKVTYLKFFNIFILFLI